MPHRVIRPFRNLLKSMSWTFSMATSPAPDRPATTRPRGVVLVLLIAAAGCGGPAPVDAPMRYDSLEKLKERLTQVSQYGDGGSSLGGIPESIDELTKTNPDLGKKLLEDFQKLNTATEKEDRKRIAKEMAERLK